MLRDARTRKKVYGPPLTVVIQATRPTGETLATRAEVLAPDLYGRDAPAPKIGFHVVDIWVWHVAYRPIARGEPKDGVILLEDHQGAPSLEIEAHLRALGEIDPAVGKALKAAFLRPGPSSRPATVPVAPAPAPAAGASGSTPEGGDPAGAPAAPSAEPTTPRHIEEMEAVARAVQTAVHPPGAAERPRALDRIDEWLAQTPRNARTRPTASLQAAVTNALSGEANREVTPRLIALAGALWHGTESAPPALSGMADVVARYDLAAREGLAVAAVRIGGPTALAEVVRLARLGALAPEGGPWVEAAVRGQRRDALRTALALEAGKLKEGSMERARLEDAIAALDMLTE